MSESNLQLDGKEVDAERGEWMGEDVQDRVRRWNKSTDSLEVQESNFKWDLEMDKNVTKNGVISSHFLEQREPFGHRILDFLKRNRDIGRL